MRPELDWVTVEVLLTEKQKSVRVRVRGTSMYPTLFSGDYVTLSPWREDLHRTSLNDVDMSTSTSRENSNLISHPSHLSPQLTAAPSPQRTASSSPSKSAEPSLPPPATPQLQYFVRAKGKYYIHSFDPLTQLTKGDNNLTHDPPAEKIIGVVINVEKTFFSYLKRICYRLLTWLKRE